MKGSPVTIRDREVVHVVDDDKFNSRSLDSLLRSVGYHVALYSTAQEFWAVQHHEKAGCLVAEVRLPDANGLYLQRHLTPGSVRLPLILMTAFGDIAMSVKAMKAGAVDFLTKPFREQDMLDAVADALEVDRRRRMEVARIAALRERFSSLTPRERQVMGLVCTGRLNKQIAGDLAVSEATIKSHRGEVMRKMSVKSPAELARLAVALGVTV